MPPPLTQPDSRHLIPGRFDHIYGLGRTAAGAWRRLDVILVPPEEWAFGLLGWIGSRAYLRFQRQLAKDRGCYLNSHRQARSGWAGGLLGSAQQAVARR